MSQIHKNSPHLESCSQSYCHVGVLCNCIKQSIVILVKVYARSYQMTRDLMMMLVRSFCGYGFYSLGFPVILAGTDATFLNLTDSHNDKNKCCHST